MPPISNPVGFGVGFLLSALLSYPTWKVLIALKSRQTVSQFAPAGHQAKQGTPTMGGIMVVLALVLGLIFCHSFTLGLPLIILFALIGFGDDFVVPRLMPGKRGLGWKQKLILELIAAAIPVAFMMDGNGLTKAWAVFLILFFANAYNFSDGQDGLAGGLGVILFGSFWLLSGPSNIGFAAAMAVGALIPFLFLNFPPAKVFMGDVGSLPLGALIGLGFFGFLSPKIAGPGSVSFDAILIWPALILSLVMLAELLPVPMQIFWVKVFKKKLFPYTPIHHAFEKAGWKETRVTAMFILIQLGLAVLAYAFMFFEVLSKGSHP